MVQIAVQLRLLAKVEQDRPRRVDNGFRRARRAGGVVDDVRILEVDAGDGGRGRVGSGSEEVVEPDGSVQV